MMRKTAIWTIVSLFVNQLLFSQSLPDKSEIIETGKLVNSYWIKNNSQYGNNDWARAVYYVGNTYFYHFFSKNEYLKYSTAWAENHRWQLRSSGQDHADAQICGQVYLDLYNMDEIKQFTKIAAIKEGIDRMVNRPAVDDWWWVDALFMSMPVFTQLGVLYEDNRYFVKMHELYTDTKLALYNTKDHLWYRDGKVSHTTPNGKASYWSRGNGWAFGALARVLDMLPKDWKDRSEYIAIFKEMAAALKNSQREDGFWNPSLIDPKDFGGVETSGTSLFLFGLAWGVNNGILDRDLYCPVIVKAWKGLADIAVQPNGLLTYVQGVGYKPSSNPATPTSTADFGVGVFLMACAETAKLASGDMPMVSNFDMVALSATDKNHILLEFSEKIDDVSALLSSNYEISNGVIVKQVEKNSDTSVILLTSDMIPGDYQLSVWNIKSNTGSSLDVGAWTFFEYIGIKSVKASDYQSGTTNTPDKVIDADMSTRWSSDGTGKWLLLDLGEERLLSSVRIAFYQGNTRVNYFNIKLSIDNKTFETVYKGESSGETEQLEDYDFAVKKARYVRIEFNGNSVSKWNSVLEVRIKMANTTAIIPVDEKPLFDIFTDSFKQGYLMILLNDIGMQSLALSIVSTNGNSIYNRTIVNNISNQIIINDLWLQKGIYICTVNLDGKGMSRLFVVK